MGQMLPTMASFVAFKSFKKCINVKLEESQ